jgi:hypothetical protein
VLGVHILVAAAEDIVLLKVLADRPQDRADVQAIVGAQGARLDLDLIAREAADIELDLPDFLRVGNRTE